MEISQTVQNALSRGAQAPHEATKSNTGMDQQAFMTLLITQLQHQDPMSPMNNEEFVSQLSQFASLEQLGSIKKNLSDLVDVQLSNNAGQAVSFLGKDVRTRSNMLFVKGGKLPELTYETDGAVTQVELRIVDSKNQVVATLRNLPGEPGANKLDLNKLLAESNQLIGDGQYTIVIGAKDEAGRPVDISSSQTGQVTAVSFKSGMPMLMVNGTEIPLSSIMEMRQPETAPASPLTPSPAIYDSM